MIPAAEWLARLHGLGHVLLARHPGGGGPGGWLLDNSWVRRAEENEEEDAVRGGKRRSRLMALAAAELRKEAEGRSEVERLLDRQDWMESLRKVSENVQ